MLVRPLPGIPSVFRPGEGPARAGGAVDGKRRSARRDLAAEAARAAAHAETLGLRAFPEMGPFAWSLGGDEDALGLVERLQTGAPEDLTVEWPDKRLKLATASVPELRVRIEEKNDWFGVDGDIEVDGRRVTLAALLEALRNNRRFVQVSPGQWLAITREFRERLRELADLSLPGKSGLELSPVAAPFLAELLEEAGLVQACASWRKLHERFQAASRLAPEPPAALAATLRDYQVDGYRWMARLAAWGAGACLADDMGLGKTVQALALLIDRAAEGPALVVAPTSVASNWLAEAARFAPTLRPLLYRETDRHIAPDTFKPGDLVIASYGLALRDAAKLEQVRWGTLILDEAQFVKNSRTQTAAAIRRIPARWRLALTGTPLENHLGDLWSLFRAVSPGLFGSWDSFRDRFAAPIERDRDPARRHALARLVRPFILRRAKSDVLQELPPRTEITLQAELSPDERALYDQARLLAAARFADPSRSRGPEERIQVLAALTRLRQLACHPRLVLHDAPASSAKLRLFLQTVAELREGRHRALVFSQFTSFLALVREALDAQKISYRYLDGSTPPRTRDAEIAAFQSGQGDLFLISLKAGGTGLNLTAADYVLHLDPWWNPAVEDQATDRAHRIGQTRPVTVYRLVAADTIEDKILAMHGDKRELVASVLEGTDRAARLSTEDLIALIREGVGEEAGVGKGRGPGA
ncbi:MAG: hypothetical protein HYY18_01350 [Planctomycetes bacterium]|nr:hypothetical protein [Planctomycetota bacterium]